MIGNHNFDQYLVNDRWEKIGKNFARQNSHRSVISADFERDISDTLYRGYVMCI